MYDDEEFELEITIDWRWDAYALLIKTRRHGRDSKSSLTFYDTLTEAKNAISVILLELNI